MKKTDWKGFAELVGIAAIVASLMFVGLEIRQTQTALMASTYQARAFDAMTAQRGLADSEYIGPILAKIEIDDYQSLEGLNNEELWRLQRFFLSRMIDFDNEYFQYQSGFLDEKYFEGQLKPGLIRNAKRWRSLGLSEFRPEFRKLVDDLLAEETVD
jgi:hypothetical protein